MRSTLVRRALQTAVVGGVVVGSMLSSVLPAHAAGPTHVVAATGSDTTYNFMTSYLTGITTSNDGTSNSPYTVQTANIPAFPTASGYSVAGDASCPAIASAPGYTGTINWVPTGTGPTTTPPVAASGSGAGRSLLLAQRAVGSPAQQVACVDIARSSSKGASGESGLEYYGFALDAVGWASTSLKAPNVLTRAQIKAIYNCTITDWGAVGGVPGPIQRYLPQNGSGTLATFLSEYLDVSSAGSLPSGQGPACPDIKQVDKNGNPFEENQGQTIADLDIDKAILPYSGGLWAFQADNSLNPTLDRRNGARLGGVQTAPTSGSPLVANVERWNGVNVAYELDYVNGSNPNGTVTDQNTTLVNSSFSKTTGFPGVRFLYNVVDTLNASSYGPAVGLVGFDNTGSPTFTSPLCNNSQRTTILSFGFAPLTTATSSFNLGGSSCRKFLGAT